MPEEVILREKAREAIRSGKLPTRKPDRTFGGPGMGKSCAVCGDTIPPEQMEFEIEFHLDGALAGRGSYHQHPWCLAAWEFERTKPGAPSDSVSL